MNEPNPFERMHRLVGPDACERLKNGTVAIVGLGGVGGFAAEALARSGVGHLRLVDFDVVGITNINRQLPALHSTVGQPKAEAMARRLADINPGAQIEALAIRCDETTLDRILQPPLDAVIDAIDLVTYKCQLLARCHSQGIPVVTSLGAAGRIDPCFVKIADLNRTEGDRLGAHVRKVLRQKYDFPKGRTRFGIPAVYSDEPAIPPWSPDGNPDYNLADSGDKARTGGSAAFVTGTFGLTLASAVFRILLGMEVLKTE